MLIRNSSEKDGVVGMRIRVVAGYCLGLCAMLGLFTTIPGEASTLQWCTIFMIGFFIYGPQVSCAFAYALQFPSSTKQEAPKVPWCSLWQRKAV